MLQPLSAQDQPFLAPLQSLRDADTAADYSVVTLDLREAVGHTFYQDLLVGPDGTINTLVVVALETLTASSADMVRQLAPHTHVALIAPRNGAAATARVVEQIPGVTEDTAVVYLSVGAPTTSWQLAVAGRLSPAWIAQAVIAADVAPFSPILVNTARLGLGQRDTVLEEALSRNQSAVRLRVEDVDRASSVILPFVRAVGPVPATATRADEQNYLIVPPIGTRTSPYVLIEAVLVWTIVTVAAILMLFAVSRPRRVRRYVSAIRHNLVLFLGLFLILVSSLSAGNLALRALGNLFSVFDLALPLAIAKFSFGLVVLTFFYPVLHRRSRRSSTVYSGAALFLLIIGSLIASVFSVILGMFFVVAFIFGFLFSLSHNAPLKTVFLILAVIPGAYVVLTVVTVGDPQAVSAILTPPIWREVVTAVLLLPLLLMFFRLDILVRTVPLLPIIGTLAVLALALTTAVVITEVNADAPPTVRILERFPPENDEITSSVPETGELTVTGETAGAPVQIRRNGRPLIACDDPPCTTEIAAPAPPVTLTTELGRSLDRYTVRYRIDYTAAARSMTFSIRTNAPVQLYAADLPADLPPGDTAAEFTFRPGPFPPRRLSGTIVLRDAPPDLRVTTRVQARFPGTGVDIVTLPEERPVTPLGHSSEWTIRSERSILAE
ncbi:MAG: O-antigen ligase [Spirochaeta sp.]|nr:O-antigen ligase [Spirochaeta sp.]